MDMKIEIFLRTDDMTILRRVGRWTLNEAFKFDGSDDNMSIGGPKTNSGGRLEFKAECELNACFRWLSRLTQKEMEENGIFADVSMSGIINFWQAHDFITQIRRLEFPVLNAYTEIREEIDDTDFSVNFKIPVSYFVVESEKTQTQAIVSVTKESAQTKNEAPFTENVMLKELKNIVRQAKSEVDMLKGIALLLKFDLEDTKLIQRAYEDYKGLSKKESMQLRDALAPAFEGKRLDYTMKDLKKLFEQTHPQTVTAEIPDSQEVTATTSVLGESSETTSASTHTPPVHYDFDNVRDEKPPHTEEGQKGDGDDTSSEEDDEEEDPHT